MPLAHTVHVAQMLSFVTAFANVPAGQVVTQVVPERKRVPEQAVHDVAVLPVHV